MEENKFDIKEEFFKYIRFWPWFIFGLVASMIIGFLFIRYSNEVYKSTAKIKIVDESKEMDLPLGDLSSLFGSNKVNLENEIEVVKSYRLLEQVVKELNLDVQYEINGNVRDIEVWDVPFKVQKTVEDDSLKMAVVYEVSLGKDAFKIIGEEGQLYKIGYNNDITDTIPGLPFKITLDSLNYNKYENRNFKIILSSIKQATLDLQTMLTVAPTNEESEIIQLDLQGENTKKTENVLNTLIEKFNQDGILDRQLVSKRTIDFINDRIVYLAEELDSIEVNKKEYKQESNISFLDADTQSTLAKREQAEQQVLNIETQQALTDMLEEALGSQKPYTLLPANIGIENSAINNLVGEYNQSILNRNNLLISAGENNPTVMGLSDQIKFSRENILHTLDVYRRQLQTSYKQLATVRGKANSLFYQLPENEKMVRAIERQQSIKEALYLLLLQKREEAAINYAVTAPSIKVVDYAITNDAPVAPKKKVILLIAVVLGLVIPFGVLYLIFMFDTKVHDRTDTEKVNPEIPVLAEIPFIEGDKIFNTGDDRSVLAESFRILSTNVDYILGSRKKGDKGKVVFVTSTIKGEGKTFVAINLAHAFASVHRKVLLVGGDLRNPQLHKYFEVQKGHNRGLSAYLHNPEIGFENCVTKDINEYCDICFSGVVPPNAPQLLTSDNFDQFMEEAKSRYDYVIMDLAPTLLVTDTLIISKYADETVYLVRAGVTDKKLLQFSKELNARKKLLNMAYIINNVGEKQSYKYGYGYRYGYGYGYTYNYGYGYGYGSDQIKSKKPWYKRLFGK